LKYKIFVLTIALWQTRNNHIAVPNCFHFINIILQNSRVKQSVQHIQHGNHFHGTRARRQQCETNNITEKYCDWFKCFRGYLETCRKMWFNRNKGNNYVFFFVVALPIANLVSFDWVMIFTPKFLGGLVFHEILIKNTNAKSQLTRFAK
jgi:hypothetical protein